MRHIWHQSCQRVWIFATVTVDYVLSVIGSLTSASSWNADILFLQGLFDIFPFVTGDLQARNIIWSTLARLLLQIQENSISISSLQQYVRVLLEKAYLIEDDLEGHASDDPGEGFKISFSGEKNECNHYICILFYD